MKMRTVELLVGAFMLAGMAALFFLAMKVSGLSMNSSEPTYKIYASFDNVGGLTARAKVTMAGVAIGRVSDIALDPKTFRARVTMDIRKSVNNISTDAAAAILTAGVLGEKYIGLTSGAEEAALKEGGEIQETQSALVLEDLIGKFLMNKVNDKEQAGE